MLGGAVSLALQLRALSHLLGPRSYIMAQRETVKGGIEHFQVCANVKKGYILKINNSAMESIV